MEKKNNYKRWQSPMTDTKKVVRPYPGRAERKAKIKLGALNEGNIKVNTTISCQEIDKEEPVSADST